jgi:hypothetical protein
MNAIIGTILVESELKAGLNKLAAAARKSRIYEAAEARG